MGETNDAGFEALIAPHRAELHAHCYRMLGSVADADDALQEALLGAWRGLAGFEGRSALRTWLYRIATNACLAVIARRPRRLLAEDYRPAADPDAELEPSVEGPLWLEPYPDDPHARYERRESLELAYVAALQYLPATQRAALLLREVLGFAATEVAEMLDTTVPSINSALQRARDTVAQRVPARSQQEALRALGDDGQRRLVAAFVDAWDRADTDALLALLTRDARFTMPPIPSWFGARRALRAPTGCAGPRFARPGPESFGSDGIDAIRRFATDRMFQTRWRLRPMTASGQLAFACYQGPDFRLGALNVVSLRGAQICEMTGFLDPAIHARFSLPDR